MAGGGGDVPVNGGEFLLQSLQRPRHHASSPSQPSQILAHDPAIAAIGPTLTFPQLFPSAVNGHELQYRPAAPWPQSSPPFAPHNFFLQGFSQNPNPSPSFSPQFNHTAHQQSLQDLSFGSLKSALNGNFSENFPQGSKAEGSLQEDRGRLLRSSGKLNGLEVEFQNSVDFDRNPRRNSSSLSAIEKDRIFSGWRGSERQGHGGNYGAAAAPPGYTDKGRRFGGNRAYGNWRGNFEHNVDKSKTNYSGLNHRSIGPNDLERRYFADDGKNRGDLLDDCGVSCQVDCHVPPAGSNLHSINASDIEVALSEVHAEYRKSGEESGNRVGDKMKLDESQGTELDDLEEQLVATLGLEDESEEKSDKKKRNGSRDKDYRSDKRGKWLLGQRLRILKRQVECRGDINRLNAPFIAIYESLIPPEEEKAKQKQLMTLLEKLVHKEWSAAKLYIYGSCANSFGFSKSDIDVCLAIEDRDINKSEVLLKLADILQADNLQNVRALTRARVPIVKLMDPVTGISCDICINNVLAVVNTKLLRDYAQIDVRLLQLAFIVKHWAKSRGVNETYHGTLSSYAYVLMCIHFLQQRRPAILPCLQEMDATYSVTVDDIECAYFDQVERLRGFGTRNGESIAQLVWAFFNYWAYGHDYANDVISVRTGSTMSKRAKDWTRRIGNDRHLICIEDPFEVSHDLGRVVDKFSIRVLREEFERAAEILQYDPNPCAKLFEPYVPS